MNAAHEAGHRYLKSGETTGVEVRRRSNETRQDDKANRGPRTEKVRELFHSLLSAESYPRGVQFLTELADAGLSLIYPSVCQLCHAQRAGPGEGYVCLPCRSRVKLIQPPLCNCCGMPFQGDISHVFTCAECHRWKPAFSRARAAAVAKGTLLEAIHKYKYESGLWLEPFLTGLLIRQAAPELSTAGWDAIVPVPLYPAKERERGFNQAERLARQLSRAAGIPLQKGFVRRHIPTPTQTRLSREERRQNVSRAFRVPSSGRVRGQRIVLVDDVFTTGATTHACASALIQAGAAEVCVWTVARGT